MQRNAAWNRTLLEKMGLVGFATAGYPGLALEIPGTHFRTASQRETYLYSQY
jgi:hypothetical protein